MAQRCRCCTCEAPLKRSSGWRGTYDLAAAARGVEMTQGGGASKGRTLRVAAILLGAAPEQSAPRPGARRAAGGDPRARGHIWEVDASPGGAACGATDRGSVRARSRRMLDSRCDLLAGPLHCCCPPELASSAEAAGARRGAEVERNGRVFKRSCTRSGRLCRPQAHRTLPQMGMRRSHVTRATKQTAWRQQRTKRAAGCGRWVRP